MIHRKLNVTCLIFTVPWSTESLLWHNLFAMVLWSTESSMWHDLFPWSHDPQKPACDMTYFPGLESVTHYPMLSVIAGILSSLMNTTDVSRYLLHLPSLELYVFNWQPAFLWITYTGPHFMKLILNQPRIYLQRKQLVTYDVQLYHRLNWGKGSPQETRHEWENSGLGFIEAVHQW